MQKIMVILSYFVKFKAMLPAFKRTGSWHLSTHKYKLIALHVVVSQTYIIIIIN